MLKQTLDSESLNRFAAVEGLGALTAEPVEARLFRIARLTRQALRGGGVVVSWRDSDGVWRHCGDGPIERVVNGDAAEPAWLSAVESSEQWVQRDTGSVAYLTAVRLSDADGECVGALALFDVTERERDGRDHERLRDYAAWVQTELRVQHLYRGQERLIEELTMTRHQALQDELTRLWNRRAMVELLGRELRRAERHVVGTGLVIASIDPGHAEHVNDAVRRAVADRLSGAVRPYDALGRYGGDEFLIMLPACPVDAVADVAERMRLGVAAEALHVGGEDVAISLSLGTAHADPSAALGGEAVTRAADSAMERARAGGGNQVQEAGDDDFAGSMPPD